jgi:hypothetical protein
MTYAIFGSYKLLLTQHVFPYYIFGIVGKRCTKKDLTNIFFLQ